MKLENTTAKTSENTKNTRPALRLRTGIRAGMEIGTRAGGLGAGKVSY